MGHPFRISISHTSRPAFHVRWRLVTIFLIAAFLEQQHLFVTSRQSLAAKYSSTDFDDGPQRALPRAAHEDVRTENELIAHRKDWKVLGEGWEGKVFAYNGSVIKTFITGRSPFRNCAPGETNEKWPTEISASLRFGGTRPSSIDNNTFFDGFLPVTAYFKSPNPPSTIPEWHLVTPFLAHGNLLSTSKTLVRTAYPMTHYQADTRFRPTFERLLSTLHHLHAHGYCHDDIKPANIFVADESTWVLGDLGNVRHVAHAYHSSRLWRDNGQLEDCRANDVMRALKSYVQFIRAVASDREEFNEGFFGAGGGLSRLFWGASNEAPRMSARRLQEMSRVQPPGSGDRTSITPPARPASVLAIVSRKWELRRAVTQAIQTRIGEKSARWWGMVYLFGVPETEHCGA